MTGRGNRSRAGAEGRAPLRDACLGLLQPLVPVRVAAKNDGLLVLLRTHLARLLRYQRRSGSDFSVLGMQSYLVEPERRDLHPRPVA